MPSQVIPLARDCPATEVPAGTLHLLKEGTPVFITQRLGGSFTITTGYGQLMRIDAKDADALGEEVPEYTKPAEEFSEEAVWNQLRMVYDPEIPINVVDLGLIYTCEIGPLDDGHKIDITMSMTAPGCGMGDVLKEDVENRLRNLPGVKQVHVEIVFDPPWGMDRISEAGRLHLGLG